MRAGSMRPRGGLSHVGSVGSPALRTHEVVLGEGADARCRALNAPLAAGVTSGSVQTLVFLCVKEG